MKKFTEKLRPVKQIVRPVKQIVILLGSINSHLARIVHVLEETYYLHDEEINRFTRRRSRRL